MASMGAYCREICTSKSAATLPFLVCFFFGRTAHLFSCPVIKICVAKLLDALDNTGRMHLHYSEAQTSIDFSANSSSQGWTETKNRPWHFLVQAAHHHHIIYIYIYMMIYTTIQKFLNSKIFLKKSLLFTKPVFV